MKEKTKAVLICLALFFVFIGGCVALIGWDEFNAPVEAPKRTKPGFTERYRKLMKERVKELEKTLREREAYPW